jgi:hypothetical protein
MLAISARFWAHNCRYCCVVGGSRCECREEKVQVAQEKFKLSEVGPNFSAPSASVTKHRHASGPKSCPGGASVQTLQRTGLRFSSATALYYEDRAWSLYSWPSQERMLSRLNTHNILMVSLTASTFVLSLHWRQRNSSSSFSYKRRYRDA